MVVVGGCVWAGGVIVVVATGVGATVVVVGAIVVVVPGSSSIPCGGRSSTVPGSRVVDPSAIVSVSGTVAMSRSRSPPKGRPARTSHAIAMIPTITAGTSHHGARCRAAAGTCCEGGVEAGTATRGGLAGGGAGVGATRAGVAATRVAVATAWPQRGQKAASGGSVAPQFVQETITPGVYQKRAVRFFSMRLSASREIGICCIDGFRADSRECRAVQEHVSIASRVMSAGSRGIPMP
jgi:hypothetical protein